MPMRHSDTSPEAEAVQIAILRRMSPGRKLELAMQVSHAARELAFAGIRRSYPEWCEAEVRREFLRRQFPPDQIPPPLR
jgi:hypothetical protein